MSDERHMSSAEIEGDGFSPEQIKVLLVDDEDRFRSNLAKRLSLRGFCVSETADGEEAIRLVRLHRPDVVLLDRKMPKMQGEEVLKEIKTLSPEVQVIMLTGFASVESAKNAGRFDVFAYLEKPCETEHLVHAIRSARREKKHAQARHEMPEVESRSIRGRLVGTNSFRPGVMFLGVLLFAAIYFMPTPSRMIELLASPKTAHGETDRIVGYAHFAKMSSGETIATYYSSKANRGVVDKTADGKPVKRPLTAEEAAAAAKVMVGVLAVAVLFWATGALPIGITAMLVGVLMYVFNVFPPDLVAKAYAKDAVIFVMGVLALSVGIAKSGLDRRIGLLLLGTSKSITRFLFLFLPLLAVTAAFLSEHALIAFIAPLMMMVYMSAIRTAGIAKDKALAVVPILGICYAANHGGPGSPAAGGRNAVMIGILTDYQCAPSFGEWVVYGLPFVPVMALVIATYFYLRFRTQIKARDTNVAAIVKAHCEKLGRMTREEYVVAAILSLVVLLWCSASDTLGMGGPALIGLVLMAAFRLIVWRDINGISWAVVALYASACAMGEGLALTGAAVWIADSFVAMLPQCMSSGEGLCIASSLFTGILTNVMSDGATVSALGPITVPMAKLSGTHPWMVGFATAFASSFANCLIIGTPNNAIAYMLAKDPDTGEQLVTMGDFLKHGLAVTCLAFLVLWSWTFFGYWQWIGFPPVN